MDLETANGIGQDKQRRQESKGVSIDHALDRTGFGSFNYFAIFVSGMILNAVYMETCGISYVIAVCQCDLPLTQNEKGILGAVAFSGIICSSYLWGYLADTYGRRCIIKPTLLIAFIFSALSSVTDNFYALVACRFFTGFFISGSSATVYPYLSEFHGAGRKDRALMGSAVIYGISCLLLPIIAFAVINQEWQFHVPVIGIIYKPWRLFFIVCSLPALFSHLALAYLPETPKFLLGQGKMGQAIEVVRMIDRWNNGNAAKMDIVEIYEDCDERPMDRHVAGMPKSRFGVIKSIWVQTAPLFKAPHLSTTILLCSIQFFICYTATGFFIFFNETLNTMANNLYSFTEQRAAMCDTIRSHPNSTGSDINATQICITKLELETLEQGIILEALFAIGFGIIGILINRVGKFPILFVLLVGSGATGFVCVLCDIPVVQVTAFMLLMCSGMAPSIATSICVALMFGRLGSVIGSNVSAILLNSYCEGAFYLSGSTLIVCGFLTFFIPKIREIPSKVSTSVIQTSSRPSISSSRVY